MTAGEAWTWVRPTPLVRSQCNPNFDSVLDFVFVNTAARPLAMTSVILQEAGDCDNAAANPDHRPLRAEFEFGAVAPAPTRAELSDFQYLQSSERLLLWNSCCTSCRTMKIKRVGIFAMDNSEG